MFLTNNSNYFTSHSFWSSFLLCNNLVSRDLLHEEGKSSRISFDTQTCFYFVVDTFTSDYSAALCRRGAPVLPGGLPEAERRSAKEPRSQMITLVFLPVFRQENLKLKELVTGPAATLDTEEPVKEESAAVRPKMEATTPQKVARIKRQRMLDPFPSFTCQIFFILKCFPVNFWPV